MQELGTEGKPIRRHDTQVRQLGRNRNSDDNTDGAAADKCSGRKFSFLLITNIVRLVGKNGGVVRIGSYGGKEYAKVANSIISVIT